jgi:hypothetical protein
MMGEMQRKLQARQALAGSGYDAPSGVKPVTAAAPKVSPAFKPVVAAAPTAAPGFKAAPAFKPAAAKPKSANTPVFKASPSKPLSKDVNADLSKCALLVWYHLISCPAMRYLGMVLSGTLLF